MLGFHLGLMSRWTSPAIFLLTSNESPLPTGKISLRQARWLPTSKSISMLVCGLFIGFLAEKFGRKRPLMILPIPAIVSSIFSTTTTNKEKKFFLTVRA